MYRKFTSIEPAIFVIAELVSCKKFRGIVKSVKFRNPMLCTGSINELLKMHIVVLDFNSKCKDSREASFHLLMNFRYRPANPLRCGKTCVSPEKYPLRHGDETLDDSRSLC